MILRARCTFKRAAWCAQWPRRIQGKSAPPAITSAGPGANTQGQRFLGSATLLTNGAGSANSSVTLNASVANGEYITATATDVSGNTSEFSASTTANTTAPNQAPVNSVPGAQAVNEDGSLVLSTANGNAIAVSDADAGSSAIQVSLSVNNGRSVRRWTAAR